MPFFHLIQVDFFILRQNINFLYNEIIDINFNHFVQRSRHIHSLYGYYKSVCLFCQSKVGTHRVFQVAIDLSYMCFTVWNSKLYRVQIVFRQFKPLSVKDLVLSPCHCSRFICIMGHLTCIFFRW